MYGHIYLDSIARTYGNLTAVYQAYHGALMHSFKCKTANIYGLDTAVEMLIPEASEKSKQQLREELLDFAKTFSGLTGVDVHIE